MKRRNFLSKATLTLIAISMSVALFAGCQSNSSSNNTSSQTTQASSNNTQKGNRPNAEQMKTRIQDSIKPLVTAGTITQDQADKIVTAYTTRPAGNEQNKSQDKQQNNQNGNNANNGQKGQNRQRFNPLSKLVTDGVITQAQADAVMQKIKESSPNKNNGQNPQNNNGQSSQNSSNQSN